MTKLNSSLKAHMALKLHKKIKKKEARGSSASQKTIDHFWSYMDQIKMEQDALIPKPITGLMPTVMPSHEHHENKLNNILVEDEPKAS